MDTARFLIENAEAILTGTVTALSGIIMVALVIPGEQPEKALQGIVDFLKRFSRK
jgi:hypothetical protein